MELSSNNPVSSYDNPHKRIHLKWSSRQITMCSIFCCFHVHLVFICLCSCFYVQLVFICLCSSYVNHFFLAIYVSSIIYVVLATDGLMAKSTVAKKPIYIYFTGFQFTLLRSPVSCFRFLDSWVHYFGWRFSCRRLGCFLFYLTWNYPVFSYDNPHERVHLKWSSWQITVCSILEHILFILLLSCAPGVSLSL